MSTSSTLHKTTACLHPFAQVVVLVACLSQLPRSLHAQSSGNFKPAAVTITGNFTADGRCSVHADGVSVFTDADSARTTYIRGAMLNAAPAGFETHEIWCAPRSEDQPMPPLDARERAFLFVIFPRTGSIASVRSYRVRTGMATTTSAPSQANAALFGMSAQIKGDSTPIRIGMVYLAATRGTLLITRASENQVVGSFDIKAQPALSM